MIPRFLHCHWIEWTIVPNERKDSQYQMTSFFPARTMSSGEVTLILMRNSRVQAQDNKSGSKLRLWKMREYGWNLYGWEQIGEAQNIIAINLFNLVPTNNHSWLSFILSLIKDMDIIQNFWIFLVMVIGALSVRVNILFDINDIILFNFFGW